MRRLLVIVSTVAVLAVSGGSARAGAPAFAVVQPSLQATIARQIDSDRHGLAQAQQRERALGLRLRAARAKLAATTYPFSYEDVVGRLQVGVASAAARIAGLNATIRRLQAALQPVHLPAALNTATTDSVGWDAVAVAEHYLGVRYLWGGSNPQSGFDCSGFVRFVYAQLGLTLAHYAATQYVTTPHIDPSELQAGDLVFFEPRADGPGHVGIYVGEGQLIEAPHTGDVVKLAPLAGLGAALGFVGATRPSELLQPLTTA
ncbi:MAG TPA: C40 family peptidase [Gaiellaceae bacterium]